MDTQLFKKGNLDLIFGKNSWAPPEMAYSTSETIYLWIQMKCTSKYTKTGWFLYHIGFKLPNRFLNIAHSMQKGSNAVIMRLLRRRKIYYELLSPIFFYTKLELVESYSERCGFSYLGLRYLVGTPMDMPWKVQKYVPLPHGVFWCRSGNFKYFDIWMV